MLSFLITHLHAADYELLAPIPQLIKAGTTNSTDINTYIPALVKLIIAIAGGLAVIRIIIGGVQYMSTDAFSGKSSAKETIQNALIGLMLAIGAYTILYTVNPKLLDTSFSLQPVPTKGGTIDTGLGGTAIVPECTTSTPCTSGVLENGTSCTRTSPCIQGFLRCPSCVVVDDNSPIPHKPSSQACLAPHPCQIEDLLEIRLRTLTNKLATSAIKVDWWVTEMYPPTAVHTSDCHKNTPKAGKCVDATIKNAGSDPDIGGRIVAFSALVFEYVKGTYQWEVPNEASKATYIGLINQWFEKYKNTEIAKSLLTHKQAVINSFKVNDCPTCTLHVHINSPSL